jgi:hypothetical protein
MRLVNSRSWLTCPGVKSGRGELWSYGSRLPVRLDMFHEVNQASLLS